MTAPNKDLLTLGKNVFEPAGKRLVRLLHRGSPDKTRDVVLGFLSAMSAWLARTFGYEAAMWLLDETRTALATAAMKALERRQAKPPPAPANDAQPPETSP